MWAGAEVRTGWGALSSQACARAGPGAEAHHCLPAGQQHHSRLAAGLAQGEEEGPSPAQLPCGWSPLTAVSSLWFGLHGLAVLEPAMAQPGWPSWRHKAGPAVGTSTWKEEQDRFGRWGGGCRNSAWASDVAQSGGDAHLALALGQHQHDPRPGRSGGGNKTPEEKGCV